jgi:glucosamine-6-phosphate deaminase
MKQNLKNTRNLTNVEKAFFTESEYKNYSTLIPYIIVNNFPKLGLFTSLRFIEWVAENPEGVISLPTGKTPEFFIKWTQYILQNWTEKNVVALLEKYGLKDTVKPDLSKLQFVQIDEFYPIPSTQHNSFYHYVQNLYIKGFGMDINNALLINSDEIPIAGGKHFNEVFPDFHVDLSLRYRSCTSAQEEIQQKSIFMIDNWCSQYEQKIRNKGGIGFFLGGIGPDGHIAFNIKGSDTFSTTRLTSTNFETQAVAAGDLGGIEISSNRQVITIGLETITYNPDAVAIIIAAGEAKAELIKQSLENELTNLYPASVLTKLKNSRFYLTDGAALNLSDTVQQFFQTGEWTQGKTERAVISLCKKLNKYGHRLVLVDLKEDPFCKLIPTLNEDTVKSVVDSIVEKIGKGMRNEENQVFLHTGPHHDDILLGILPLIERHFRSLSNKFYFSVLTSGFNAITNTYVINALQETKKYLDVGLIQMVNYLDFFESGYKYKWDKDVYHYLTNLAAGDDFQRIRGLCHRIVRALTEIANIKTGEQLRDTINECLSILKNSYDGEKNPPKIQRLKGMIREFEEELVWAHYGVPVKNVIHNRLGFYKGDIFTEQPEKKRDVQPILEMFRRINPTVISLAFDPEGSGPDTHYKVLQAIAEGLREWKKEKKDMSNVRIWGYRNVWYKFNPADANVIVPVSLSQMSTMGSIFTDCYLSQVDASFPSYELNGKFSTLAQKIWVQQLQSLQFLLGKDYFYMNENPELRASHGLIFFKEMEVDEFLMHARELEKSTEGNIKL